MDVFLSLFMNLLPLYALIALGYCAGKFLHVDRQSIGTLAIYIFMPIVVFGFVSNLEFQPAYVILPVIVFLINMFVGFGFYSIGKRVYCDNQANLMAICASMGNTGYFGLPLVMLFFDADIVAIYIFMMLGGSFFEATGGYYIIARSSFTVRDSLLKILKFPAIYAMILGLIVNITDFTLPDQFWVYWAHFKGAYIIVGMMIVGAALAKINEFVLGPRFIMLVFFGKFIVWPLSAFCFVMIDRVWLQWFDSDIHKLLVMMAVVPPGANIVAFAAQVGLPPEKAATTILIGTLFALFYIPFIIWLIGMS